MAECGIKSIMYAGEGEPLLHKDIIELITHTKNSAIDTALNTNGILLDKNMAEGIIRHLSWLRVSLDAGSPNVYSQIHQCDKKDFGKAIENIAGAIKLKKKNKYRCVIGAQLVFLRHNYKEIAKLTTLLKKIKIDYLIIKPYSHHLKSKNDLAGTNAYSHLYSRLAKELGGLGDSNFKIIFRPNALQRLSANKSYKQCLGLPFWTYISSSGDIYACSAFLGDKKFSYGNIYKEDFRRIWNAKRRTQVLAMFFKRIDIAACRRACRLDAINQYLWELKHLPEHINFI